jgi:hypothetical protein
MMRSNRIGKRQKVWEKLVGGGALHCSTRRIMATFFVLYLIVTFLQLRIVDVGSTTTTTSIIPQLQESRDHCAINLWGLPRAFKSIVLPSLVENVIIPNAEYECDYFVHYYEVTTEAAGRSGGGGTINPEEVKLLREKVLKVAKDRNKRIPHVGFVSDKEETFWARYGELIERIRNEKDDQNRYLYFPWKALTYRHPLTTDNIIKMWHTIQSSWNLMHQYAKQNGIEYSRVAMLRSDVLYATKIDIYEIQPNVKDEKNRVAVIPGFGRHPVSDRLIYGPARAVEVWATHRFQLLDSHVKWILQHDPGWGMHSERFVNYTLFPAIRQRGVEIVEHDTICFFRARPDETVWWADCQGKPSIMANRSEKRKLVERILGRSCGKTIMTQRPRMEILNCSRG